VLWDDNSISIDGPTSLSTSENQVARFQAANWATLCVSGTKGAALEVSTSGRLPHDATAESRALVLRATGM